MKSLLTKIISILSIVIICVSLCACTETTANKENCVDEHAFVLTSYTAPTCKTIGAEVYQCSRCGYTETKTLLQVDHDYEIKSTTPSTCTIHGTQTLECSMCHETKTDTLPLKDHDYKLVNDMSSTCSAKGSKTYQCESCSDTYTIEQDLLKHDYQLINSIPSTCTKKGTKEYECSVCKDKHIDELDLVSHSLEKINTATCFTAGKLKNVCTNCDYEEVNEESNMIAHEFGEDGYCTECGIYETLFDEDQLNVTWKELHGDSIHHTFDDIHGYLKPKFNNNSIVPDEYFIEHTIFVNLSFYNKDNKFLESREFSSFIIPWDGFGYKGKPTVQFGGSTNGYAYEFFLRFWLQKAFEETTLANAISFKLEICCEGYKTIEKTYYITGVQ